MCQNKTTSNDKENWLPVNGKIVTNLKDMSHNTKESRAASSVSHSADMMSSGVARFLGTGDKKSQWPPLTEITKLKITIIY